MTQRPPLVVNANGKTRLLCSCASLLPIRQTAYGRMAICSACGVRWTSIAEHDQGLWVAETR